MKKFVENKIISPEFIFVPFEKSVKIKEEDNICFEEILGVNSQNEYIYSSISGLFIKEKEVYTSNGKTNSLVIENDFMDKRKDNYPSLKTLYSLKKDEIISELSKYNIKLPKVVNVNIYYKYNNSSESLLFEEYKEEVLELLDIINTTLKRKVNLLVKSKDDIVNDALLKYIATYPNIHIIYDKEENEKIEIFHIVKIYHILKNKRLFTYKYITIINKNSVTNVKVKLYSKVLDVIKELNFSEIKGISVFDINGKEFYHENVVVDENTVCIILT